MSHLDRASPGDVVNLAVDRGTVPMNIAALLTFDPAGRPLAADVADVVGARVARVPRLTRRLVGTPLGCGRPVWVDDGSFSLGAHLSVQPLAAGPDDPSLEAATDLVLRRLPRDRPLWTARVLADDDGLASDLVIVMHHALADGIGWLAVLAALADGAPDGAVRRPPRPLPPPVDLARDAWRERVRGVRDAGTRLRGLRSGLRELGGGLPHLAEPTTLLAAPSARRRVDVLDAPLGPVVSAAHAAGARVNDVVVVAVADALGALLRSRQDPLTTLVVSVPVSARSATNAGELGTGSG